MYQGENMFRPLRRKKNERTMDQAKALLHSARRGVLAVNGDAGYPYAIPINYWYDEDAQRIIFHSAKAGHKVDALNASDKVCFTVYGEAIVRKEEWAPYVESAVVFGRCHTIEEEESAKAALVQFARKYYPSEDLIVQAMERSWHGVRMYQIDIEHLSGKEVQER